ncbi:TetR/AcrR family transcriptional regulator [Erwinia sp. JUb26]|uniref:TetR/AcrR family transcriptional regulator n=1 Tax=Erwinia sp. JUb26 TaxID=2485126 RepID=UPI000F4669EE|nr:TetR family transcriptional regulator [Erwinia sp. JUb26]ROR13689.1 TetR family transcriptional regulator [Erwinia sp. JUb26]
MVGETRTAAKMKKKIIIDATLRVLRKQGINQCNHRAVAEEAGVPLGSTTYYFKSLDDLLEAAMRSYLYDFKAITESWFSEHAALPPADIVIKFLVATLMDRKLIHHEYEMYAAAISRPALRPLSLSWLLIIEDMMLKYVTGDRLKSKLLSLMIDSLLMRSVLEPDSILFDEVNLVTTIHLLLQE